MNTKSWKMGYYPMKYPPLKTIEDHLTKIESFGHKASVSFIRDHISTTQKYVDILVEACADLGDRYIDQQEKLDALLTLVAELDPENFAVKELIRILTGVVE